MVSQSVFALRERQLVVLQAVLSLDQSRREWKVLVCDSFADDIINTLFTPPALRGHGITLHTIIDAPRGPVPDVPALYLLSATPDNIARVSNDLTNRPLYHRATIAFTTCISRSLLAALAAQLPVPSPITRVHDVYSSFIALEQNLFTLNMRNSYIRMHDVTDEASLNAFVCPIVDGIFSVLLTLGVVPIIRSQRGGAAEAVSAALDRRLRDNLDMFQKSSLSSRALSFRRPLLLMLDRDFDFGAILHHTWTYQALVHDCLDMTHNLVTVDISENGPGSKSSKKKYMLDKETDVFWANNAASPFPTVAERIESALTQYRAEVEEINNKAGGGSALQRGEASSGRSMGTSHLAAAISSLPELSKRKETIDVHTNIATALLNNINSRSLDTFFELEHQLLSEAGRPIASMSAEEYKVPMLELLRGVRETATGEKRGEGSAADRLRLFLIYYGVFGRQLSEKDMAEFRGILQGAGADTSVIEYTGKLKAYRHDLVRSKEVPTSTGTINAAKLKGLMTSVVNRGYRSIANVAQNAKKLILEQKKSLAVAKTLDLFMSEQSRGTSEASASDILDGYLLFDPKVMPSSGSVTQRASATGFGPPDESKRETSRRKTLHMVYSDAIVFTVGGGNYVEFDDCLDRMATNSPASSRKNVLYGTTELMTPESFLKQLSTVAQKSRVRPDGR